MRVRKYKKPVGNSWRMDETYIKVNGERIYLYRAVDSLGATIDFLLRKYRYKASVKAFFRKVFKYNGRPDKVVIDKSGSNISALNSINKDVPNDQQIQVLQNKYLNNIVEQDHRFIKKRTKPMLGFKSFHSAAIILFCFYELFFENIMDSHAHVLYVRLAPRFGNACYYHLSTFHLQAVYYHWYRKYSYNSKKTNYWS